MQANTPKSIGDSLEDAVRAIESAILSSAPGFAEGTFRIEGQKILVIAGVRHEIDIFVTASLASGYEAVFIFECKNWQEKVGKNELIIFSEKIRAIGAQKGFFVARTFTRDAEAQAALDQRVELLIATILDPSAVMVPAGFHGIHIGETKVEVLALGFNKAAGDKRTPIDPVGTIITIDGASQNFGEYIQKWSEETRNARVNVFPSMTVSEGTHELAFEAEREFPEGAALMNGKPTRRIELKGTVQVTITRAVVVSAFEVKSRGRLITVQLTSPVAEITAGFVMLADPAAKGATSTA